VIQVSTLDAIVRLLGTSWAVELAVRIALGAVEGAPSRTVAPLGTILKEGIVMLVRLIAPAGTGVPEPADKHHSRSNNWRVLQRSRLSSEMGWFFYASQPIAWALVTVSWVNQE